mmetsp:Transcript_23203/g.53384  ORF Transcript_23203/g.53384 Transcript_23203/m.53384 type:complete len:201 (+) Transcript_23203:2918-3520(+)
MLTNPLDKLLMKPTGTVLKKSELELQEVTDDTSDTTDVVDTDFVQPPPKEDVRSLPKLYFHPDSGLPAPPPDTDSDGNEIEISDGIPETDLVSTDDLTEKCKNMDSSSDIDDCRDSDILDEDSQVLGLKKNDLLHTFTVSTHISNELNELEISTGPQTFIDESDSTPQLDPELQKTFLPDQLVEGVDYRVSDKGTIVYIL